jgi:hypothetical protein
LLASWIPRLPPSIWREDGWLLFWFGTALLGIDKGAKDLLEEALVQLDEAGDTLGTLMTTAALVHATVILGVDLRPLDQLLERLGRLAETLEGRLPPALALHVGTTMLLGHVLRTPPCSRSPGWLDRARRLSESVQDLARHPFDTGVRILHHCLAGDSAQGAAILDLLKRSPTFESAEPLAVALQKLGQTLVSLLACDLPAALGAAREGLENGRQSGVAAWTDTFLTYGAYAAIAGGDFDAAAGFIDQLGAIASLGRVLDLSNYHFVAGWRAALTGDLARAASDAERAASTAASLGSPFCEAFGLMLRAFVDVEAGRPLAAGERLEFARRHIEAHCPVALLLGSWHWLAAHHALVRGARDEALERLGDALRIQREAGYSYVIWPGPRTAGDLCLLGLEHDLDRERLGLQITARSLLPSSTPITSERWPFRLRIRCLGAPSIEIDGVPLAPRGKVQRMPLALLRALVSHGAFNAGSVGEAEIAESLWPDSEGDAGRGALHTTLHRLRKLLGDDQAITLSGGALRIDPARVWLDVGALSCALADKQPQVERIMSLYRGPLFAGEDEWPFVLAARERLHQRVLRILERLAGQAAQDGERAEAARISDHAEALRRVRSVIAPSGR